MTVTRRLSVMENLSPEIWTTADRGSRWPDDERNTKPPRPAEVLVKIGLVLLAHVVVVLLVVWTLHAFGIR